MHRHTGVATSLGSGSSSESSGEQGECVEISDLSGTAFGHRHEHVVASIGLADRKGAANEQPETSDP